jgi:hypothetical protein
VLLFIVIAQKHLLNLFKSVTKQAFLHGDIYKEKIYMCPPDWWPKHVAHGYVLKLIKSMYCTLQAAPPLHVWTSTWMEEHGYLAVKIQFTIFMKHEGVDAARIVC